MDLQKLILVHHFVPFVQRFLIQCNCICTNSSQSCGPAVHDSPSTRKLGLQLAVTIMVSRKPADGEYRNELIHADAFDGTVIGLAFLCSKMGTRLFPDAVFVQAPVEQFINETLSGRRNGFSPVVPDRCGAMRTLQPGALLIIPAAVAPHGPTGAWMSIHPQDPAGLHEPTWNFDPQWEDVRGTSSAWK